jgi:uncharacterized small protein (DUF1192 family)
MGRIADALRDGVSMPEQKRRQILALDREFVEMETQIQSLETKILHLEAKVNPLQREVERLKNQIEKKGATVHKLQSEEIEVMKLIGEKRSCTSSDIQAAMSMHPVQTEHMLGQLLKSDYVEQEHVPMIGPMYSLSDSGNAYLVENKLVPLKIGGTKDERPNNPKGHHCDHCGSVQLRRTGSRRDPNFGDLGIKEALYFCLSCERESAFTDDN